MEKFIISGENGNYLKISFEEVFGYPVSTCHWGGYELRVNLEIKSGSIIARSNLWTSTGEIFEFYKKLECCHKELKGVATYTNYEGNLEVIISYENLGQVNVAGRFNEIGPYENELKYKFPSDQSYLSLTIDNLKTIAFKYGNIKGVNE